MARRSTPQLVVHAVLLHRRFRLVSDILARGVGRSRSRRRYSINDGSTRAVSYGALSMNELNSHCSDAVITMTAAPFPAPRSALLSRLIVLICAALHELYPPPRRFRCTAPFLSRFYYCSRISLRIQRFPAFFTSLHFARREP